MISKLLIVFMSSVAGLFLGLAFCNKLVEKEKYFVSLIAFIERLISDIKFSQKHISLILTSFNSNCNSLNKNLSEYSAFLKNNNNVSTLSLSKGVLNNREITIITEFFLRLGTMDLDCQISELINQKDVFNSVKSDVSQKCKNMSKACVKLGLLSGLLIGVLLI